MLGAVPDRYRAGAAVDGSALDVYFAMARGSAERAPLRMTKWFDTNYHYIVPEIGDTTEFRLERQQAGGRGPGGEGTGADHAPGVARAGHVPPALAECARQFRGLLAVESVGRRA